MIQTILNLTQPLAVIIFLISGTCSIYLKQYQQGAIHLCFALANTMIFYGHLIFRR